MGHGRALAVLLPAVGMTVALLGGPVEQVGAHGTRPMGLSERELVRVETEVLGRAHAAEHASGRAAQRRERARRAALTPAQRRAEDARVARSARRVKARAAAFTPARDGRWDAPFDIPITGIHTALLPTGKVMFFSHPGDRSRNVAEAWLWDPAKGRNRNAFTLTDLPEDANGKTLNIWCGGQSLLPDGRLLVTGGNLEYDPPGAAYYKGLDTILTFDPWKETWTLEGRMVTRGPNGVPGGRWYPTQTLMADGRTLILSGMSEEGLAYNHEIELFPGRGGAATERIGRYRYTDEPAEQVWPDTGGLYPHVFLMPSGGALHVGPRVEDSWLLRSTNPFAWEDRPGGTQWREYSTAILVPDGPGGSTRVMQIGGYDKGRGLESVRTSEIVDERAPQAGPTGGPSLVVGRSHHNTVHLPDGGMVTVGGGYGNREGTGPGWQGSHLWAAGEEHKSIELFENGEWRLGPPQVRKRAYHSTAILLPDGSVVSAGDDGADGAVQDKAEVYEPPYLHTAGARPVIDEAPGAVRWGQRFFVGTRSADVRSARLIAPGATTHANDMSQRSIPLELHQRRDGKGVELVAPPGPTIAPPAYYMLFVVDANGKPSVASWIRLGSDAADAVIPEDVAPTPASAPAPAVASEPQPASSAPATGTAPAPAAARPAQPAAPTTAPPPAAPTRSTPVRPTAGAPRDALTLLDDLAGIRRTRRMRVRVVPAATGRATLTVRLGAGPALRASSLRLRAGRARTVTLRLTPSARRRIARARSVRVAVALRVRPARGAAYTWSGRVTLRR